MKVVSIVGARPQLVKLAAVAAAIERTPHEHVIVHTGQHYDADLSDVFFDGLGIPAPDVHLGIGSAGHGAQTGGALAVLDPVLEELRPDWVLVYGDTNSTLAGALSAVKTGLRTAHLEAGLRSFNRRMPEEHNRVLTDHCADLLLAPTREAMRHLEQEGLSGRSVLVGDVMADVCLRVRDAVAADGHGAPAGRRGTRDTDGAAAGGRHGAGAPPRLAELLPDGIDPAMPYLVATVHRAENTDDPQRLRALADALAELPLPVALPAHPRLLARAKQHGVVLERGAVRVGRPLPYAGLVAAVLGAAGVVTDSGGLQKEAFWLGRPCTTLRGETEWPETLAGGWNVLVPDPAAHDGFAGTANRPAPTARRGTPYGDGHAAERVVRALEAFAELDAPPRAAEASGQARGAAGPRPGGEHAGTAPSDGGGAPRPDSAEPRERGAHGEPPGRRSRPRRRGEQGRKETSVSTRSTR